MLNIKKNNSKEKLIMNLSTVFLEIQQFVSNTLQVLFKKNSSSSPMEIGRRKNIDWNLIRWIKKLFSMIFRQVIWFACIFLGTCYTHHQRYFFINEFVIRSTKMRHHFFVRQLLMMKFWEKKRKIDKKNKKSRNMKKEKITKYEKII